MTVTFNSHVGDARSAGQEPSASPQPQTASLFLPAQLCRVLPTVTPALFSHPGLARGQDPRRGRGGAREGSSSAVELRHPSMCSSPRAKLPVWPLSPFIALAGQAPALQSCQLSWGAYASPAVPPGAGAFVPSWCRGGQSPQLRAEHPSKHQSPSVLPAKSHRPALLVPRSPIARPAPPRAF